MAPKNRIAHRNKFTEKITKKLAVIPCDANKRKFLDEEVNETKRKKQKRSHTKPVNSAPKIISEEKEPLIQAENNSKPTEHSYRTHSVHFNRSFESRPRCLPDFVERKINSLIEFVNNLPKRTLRKRKIIPISGIEPKNVYARVYQNYRK